MIMDISLNLKPCIEILVSKKNVDLVPRFFKKWNPELKKVSVEKKRSTEDEVKRKFNNCEVKVIREVHSCFKGLEPELQCFHR
jgi:hypothetical protein